MKHHQPPTRGRGNKDSQSHGRKTGGHVPSGRPERSSTRSPARSRGSQDRLAPSGPQWLYGRHAVLAALANPERDLQLLVLNGRVDTSDTQLAAAVASYSKRGGRVDIQGADWFTKKFGQHTVHQGIALQAAPLETLALEDILGTADGVKPSGILLLLDQIVDPQNVGAILRSAAAFGAKAVVWPNDAAPEITPALAKAASGGLEVVPIVRVVNLVRAMEEIKQAGYWCVGLAESGTKRLPEVDLKGPVALVVGQEGAGLRRLVREHCDHLAHLPTSDQFSTLNAAQAATLALYEAKRQQG